MVTFATTELLLQDVPRPCELTVSRQYSHLPHTPTTTTVSPPPHEQHPRRRKVTSRERREKEKEKDEGERERRGGSPAK